MNKPIKLPPCIVTKPQINPALYHIRNKIKIFNIHFENSLTIYSDLILYVHAIGKFSRNRQGERESGGKEKLKMWRGKIHGKSRNIMWFYIKSKAQKSQRNEGKKNPNLISSMAKIRAQKKNIFEARKINHFDLYWNSLYVVSFKQGGSEWGQWRRGHTTQICIIERKTLWFPFVASSRPSERERF